MTNETSIASMVNAEIERSSAYVLSLREALEKIEREGVGINAWIIQCEGVCLTFDVSGTKPIHPMVCQPHTAERFPREKAQQMAVAVRNGNGTRGNFIHVTQAIRESIEQQESLIKILHTCKESKQ